MKPTQGKTTKTERYNTTKKQLNTANEELYGTKAGRWASTRSAAEINPGVGGG